MWFSETSDLNLIINKVYGYRFPPASADALSLLQLLGGVVLVGEPSERLGDATLLAGTGDAERLEARLAGEEDLDREALRLEGDVDLFLIWLPPGDPDGGRPPP